MANKSKIPIKLKKTIEDKLRDIESTIKKAATTVENLSIIIYNCNEATQPIIEYHISYYESLRQQFEEERSRLQEQFDSYLGPHYS